jgi:alpha-mannosidase
MHEFTYSILPHVGDFRDGGVIREAHSLNQPLVAMEIGESRGELPESFSLVSVKESAVVIDTVKRAENSDATIVRLYEAFGGATTAHITVADGFKKAYICDLMENKEREIEISAGSVTLPLGACEIATLMLCK